MGVQIRFKKIIQQICFFSVICFFTTSCLFFQPNMGKKEERNRECSAGSAGFIAEQISPPPNNTPIAITSKDGLADKFILNLRVCLKDARHPDTSIQNSSFIVAYKNNLSNEEKKINVISGSDGCIQWQEQYKYKYTLNSTWIGIKRTIKQADGAYPGAVEVLTAVNPWLSPQEIGDGMPHILDMRCEYTPNDHFILERKDENNIIYHKDGLKFLEKADERKPMLWAPESFMQITEISNKKEEEGKEDDIRKLLTKYVSSCIANNKDNNQTECYKRYFRFNFRFPLEFRSLTSTGSSFDTRLNGGFYNIRSVLFIIPKADNKPYKLAECKNEKVEINKENKSLGFQCEFDIAFFNQNSVFKIFHRISSVNSDNPGKSDYLPLRYFEGLHTISFSFGSELKKITIDLWDNNSYSKVLKDPQENLNIISDFNLDMIEVPIQTQNMVVDSKILRLGDDSEFKYSNIQSGESTVKRKVNFVGRICLKDPLNSQKTANTKYRVFLQRPGEKNDSQKDNQMPLLPGQIEEIFSSPSHHEKLFVANNQGCLTISVKLEHNIYDRQKYFEIVVHVLSEELNLYGSTKIALNPWQRAFQAFHNAAELSEQDIRFNVDGIKKPELVINQFRMINLFPSYGLDQLLNIHLFHRFYLLFQPFIRRPDNVSLGLDHKSRELLRDGYYLVRVLILRSPKESRDVLRVQKQEELRRQGSKVAQKDSISFLKEGDYITHTDSVVRAKANFVNFYMPIYLSTKQMYYIASRNMIVIQIYPADPECIKYNEDGSVDKKQTQWKAFLGHDLINTPYTGVLNLQNWVNWNLLQKAEIDTDKIIKSSEIGSKYKHFDFSKVEGSAKNKHSTCSGNPAVDEATERFESSDDLAVNSGAAKAPVVSCVDSLIQDEEYQKGIQKEISRPALGADGEMSLILRDQYDKNLAKQTISKCDNERTEKKPGPDIERYKEEIESQYTTDILSKFSLENALKPIVLGSENGQKLVEDLQRSYEEYLRFDYNNPDYNFNTDELFYDVPYYKKHKQKFFNVLRRHKLGVSECFGKSQAKKFCRGDFVQSYLMMLKKIEKHGYVLNAVSEFIAGNTDIFGNQQDALFINCQEDDTAEDCQSKKHKQIFKTLRNLDIPQVLSFNNSITRERFIKKQAFIFMLLSMIPEQNENFLEELLNKNPYEDLVSASSEKSEVYLNKIMNVLSTKEEAILKFLAEQHVIFIRQIAQQQINNFIGHNGSDSISQIQKDSSFLKEESIKKIVSKGLHSENIHTEKNVGFVKSLCLFWFNKFLKDYLDKELKISAYTNYTRKFDYLQLLEHAYARNKIDPEGLIDILLENKQKVHDKQSDADCSKKYRECVTADFCSRDKSEERSNFIPCQIYSEQESNRANTCSELLKGFCSVKKNKTLDLCGKNDTNNEGFLQCHQKVNYFCRMNPDKSFCKEYENRCFQRYGKCLQSSDSFSLFDKNLDQVIQSYREPIETCINDFQQFFKIENKMIVYDVHRNKYERGVLRNFVVSNNNSIGSYMNWTAQRGRSLSVSFDPIKFLFSSLTLGLSGSMTQNQSSNESNSGRVAWDSRAGESVVLAIGTAEIKMEVKKFQKCLVLKPRPNSFMSSFKKAVPVDYNDVWSSGASDLDKVVFSRPGLILCSPIEERDLNQLEEITESYYYISQVTDPSNSQFLDLYDLANRPFLLILRGKREFYKFYHVSRRLSPEHPINEQPGNPFLKHIDIVEHTRGLTLNLRELSETGFYPGIHDIPYDVGQEIDASFNSLEKNKRNLIYNLRFLNLFSVPPTRRDNVIPIRPP